MEKYRSQLLTEKSQRQIYMDEIYQSYAWTLKTVLVTSAADVVDDDDDDEEEGWGF